MRNFGPLVLVTSFLVVLGCGQDVKIVEMEPTSINLNKRSQSRKVEAIAKDIRDATVPNIQFTFSSENDSIATVSSEGMVKPTGDGSTAIIATTATGVTGETFVKVCLPKELVCEPSDLLKLKEGLAAPIKCEVHNCKDEPINGAKIEFAPADKTMLLKEDRNVFIGLKIGDTEVTVTAFDLERKVKVRVDEQSYLPGMEPGAGGGGGGNRRGGGKQADDPYGKSRFDHILKNMKFKE